MKHLRRLLFLLLGALVVLGHEEAGGLVFHFEFGGAQGLTQLKDRSGRITLKSENGGMIVQEGALRLAEGARISISADQLPRLTERFTFNIWLVKNFFGDFSPVAFKGLHPGEVQFLLSMARCAPKFVYKNESGQRSWKGIDAPAGFGATEYIFPGGHRVGKTSPLVKPGEWTMVSWVFDEGDIRIYRNGELVLERIGGGGETLRENRHPLYLGCELLAGASLNYRSANLLVNDFRCYDRALSEAEIRRLHEQESHGYPRKNLFPKDAVKYPDCHGYMRALLKDLDPEFRNKMPLTEKYERSLPEALPPGKGNTTSRIRIEGGQARLVVNNREFFPMLFFPAQVRDNRFLESSLYLIQRDFAAAGMKLGGCGVSILHWKDRREYDFEKMDDIIRKALKAQPRQLIAIGLLVRPHFWFFRKHFDELERFRPGGDPGGGLSPYYLSAPLGSEVWLECSDEYLEDVIGHLESQDFADRIYCYRLYCGDAGEWYWPGSFTGGTPGYSEATARTFRRWLAAKYKDDDALRRSWNRPEVTLATAAAPAPELRFASECFNFRDQSKARQVLDFREYMMDVTFKNILHNTRAIKKASGWRKNVVVYHGYALLYAGLQKTMHYGGLQILGRVLRLDSIDGCATPLDYTARRGGQPGLNINAFSASARLHGKMTWQENDLRTHLHPKAVFGRTDDAAETATVMRRGFGWALTGNTGFWWCVLGDNCEWHQKDILEEVRRIRTAADRTLEFDRASNAQVALIFDERSTLHTGIPRNELIKGHTWDLYSNASRMGAPFDAYLLDDLDDPHMPDYRLYIFLNIYYTDEQTRAAVAAKIRRNGAVAVWCYAPGFITDKGFSDKAMQSLTGLDLRSELSEPTGRLVLTREGREVFRSSGSQRSYPVGPWFWCGPQEGLEIWGTFQGRPALVAREFPGWRSVFSLMPLDAGMLRGLCEYAGVPVYSHSGDIFAANRSFIMLHAVKDGDKTIELPEPATVTELFTGERLGRNVRRFVDPAVKRQATRIYLLEK